MPARRAADRCAGPWRHRAVHVPEMPPPPGLYSRAVRVGAGHELLFVSGQAAVDEEGRLVGAGDVQAQARQALTNMAKVLRAGGAMMADVVKLTVFVKDVASVGEISAVRAEFFSEPFPASTLVEVSGFTGAGFLLEIDAIAVCPVRDG